jgi:hypothetical protein
MSQVSLQLKLKNPHLKPAHIQRKRLIDPLNKEAQNEAGTYRS